MPLVNVMVNSRAYTIACDEGEEEHLKELAAHVDSKVRELLGSVGQVGDQRLLLMAAVLITDELFEAPRRASSPDSPPPTPTEPSRTAPFRLTTPPRTGPKRPCARVFPPLTKYAGS